MSLEELLSGMSIWVEGNELVILEMQLEALNGWIMLMQRETKDPPAGLTSRYITVIKMLFDLIDGSSIFPLNRDTRSIVIL